MQGLSVATIPTDLSGFGKTITSQARSHRVALEAHSASDNSLPLTIPAASFGSS
jgi:hypothetical protein